ncbi:DUF5047 domain-containing protein [uncultured Deinococcus sp.]|uniref:DUF5047 domain-containing protein n=1 Tax=uncultured Deinococcus sp. TaxID=158789 RepID=UPI0025D54127|nr:DUF5047 domain-containing protein [uncultured Deinococcus sp.]
MLALSPAASEALRTSHQIDQRVTAYTVAQGALILDSVTGGTVTCDGKAAVRRSLDLDVADPTMFPTSASDPLSEVASEIGVEYGVVLPGAGTEWLRVFRGPIQEVSATLVRAKPNLLVSGLKVSAAGRAQRLVDNRLLAPIQTRPGPVVPELTRLILLGDPTAEVLDMTGGDGSTAGALDVDKDRWSDGILKLAASAGLAVDTAPSGAYRIRKVATLDDPPVWRIDAGGGGVLVKADLKRTRAAVYNGVQASGEQNDGTPTVSALVVDDDPASPTFWGGPFGQKVRYYSNPAIKEVGQAQKAARALLEKVRGLSKTVELTAVTNPAFEEGDVIEVDLGDGNIERHILDGFPISLTPSTQTLTTRALELPAEQ